MVIILSRDEVILKREGKISRSGHGAGVYLSKEELEKIGLDVGDEVEIEVTADGKIVLKPKPIIYHKLISDALVGLVLGDVMDIGGAQIIPLYLPKKPEERDYITIKEAIEEHKVEIRDSGVISTVIISNTGDRSVFVAHGLVIEGGTQPRTVVTNALISPNKTVGLPSRCVHQIRGISRGAKMKPIGFAPRQIAFGLTTTTDRINQHSIWSNISAFLDGTSVTYESVAPQFLCLVDNSTKWRSTAGDLSRAIHDFKYVVKQALKEEEKYARKRKSSWNRHRKEW